MLAWLKRLFGIGVKVYETKNPDALTKEVLDVVNNEINGTGSTEAIEEVIEKVITKAVE